MRQSISSTLKISWHIMQLAGLWKQSLSMLTGTNHSSLPHLHIKTIINAVILEVLHFQNRRLFLSFLAFFLFVGGPIQKYILPLLNFFVFGHAGSLPLHAGRLSLAVKAGAAHWSRCSGCFCRGARAPAQGFGGCGAWPQLPWSMWTLPRPGRALGSPALAGRFLTTGPPGKSQRYLLFRYVTLSESVLVNMCIYSKQMYLHSTVNFSVTKR